MTRYTIEFYRDEQHEWRWRVRHTNRRIVADSGEGYKRLVYCQRGLTRMLDAKPELFRVTFLEAVK